MNRVDDRGKVFTERVRKARVEVKIVTVRGYVHGYVHLTVGQRVKDLLNNNERFLAITAAMLRDFDADPDSEPQLAEFIALNKDHIVSVTPVDEEHLKSLQEDEYTVPY